MESDRLTFTTDDWSSLSPDAVSHNVEFLPLLIWMIVGAVLGAIVNSRIWSSDSSAQTSSLPAATFQSTTATPNAADPGRTGNEDGKRPTTPKKDA